MYQPSIGRVLPGTAHRLLNLLYALSVTQTAVAQTLERGLLAQTSSGNGVSNRTNLARGLARCMTAMQDLLENEELREQDITDYLEEGDPFLSEINEMLHDAENQTEAE